MPDVSFVNLFIVCLVAAAAPLALGFAPRLRLPSVILEIVAGIVLGPSVLGWVKVDLPVQVLGLIGLAFLLFLSGLEIDAHRLRGRLLRVAVLGYLITLALGVPIGVALHSAGWVRSPLLLAIALSATSLGLVVPVLKDAGKSDGEVGQTAIVAATVADFSAILLLSLFFSASNGSTGSRVVLLIAFAVLVAVTGLVVSRTGRSMRLGSVLLRLQDTTAEIRVRFAVVLLIAFTALAERFGLESILGAFLAGVVVSIVDRDSASHPNFRTKLEAIGFGFLIPVFFISSGIRLDLKGLLDAPSALIRVPIFLLALLIVRGVPALLYVRTQGRRSAIAAGLLQATSLPFIVTATQIGVQLGRIISGHRRRARVRRPAVGAVLPGDRIEPAATGRIGAVGRGTRAAAGHLHDDVARPAPLPVDRGGRHVVGHAGHPAAQARGPFRHTVQDIDLVAYANGCRRDDPAVEGCHAVETLINGAQYVEVLRAGIGVDRRHDATRSQRIHADDGIADAQRTAGPIAFLLGAGSGDDDVRAQATPVVTQSLNLGVRGDEQRQDVEPLRPGVAA